MKKHVITEKLPSGNYRVRHWEGDKLLSEWFSDYGLAKRRAADLEVILLAKKQGQIVPLKPLEIMEQYLASLAATHRESTIHMKREVLTPLLASTQSLNSGKIKEWKTEMLAKYSVSTVSIRLREIRALCNWASKEGLLEEKLFATISIPSSKEAGTKLSLEDIQKIWDNSDECFKPYLGFLIYTGARMGEILHADWNDINIPQGLWRIPAENCKTKRERTVPLDEALLKILRPIQKANGRVFPWRYHRSPHMYLERACEKAKVAKPRIHDFRHTYASYWNGDPRKLMDKLGWKHVAMLKRYSHFTVEDIRKESEEKGIAASLDLNPAPKLKVL